MKDDNNKLYIVAFVAIVAIMALAYMFNPNVCTGTRENSLTGVTTTDQEAIDYLIGNAARMSLKERCDWMMAHPATFDCGLDSGTWCSNNCDVGGATWHMG